MSLKDDVTFGVSTKQAPHCLAWAVLARRFGRLAGNRSGRGRAVRNCTKTCLCLREVVCWLLLPCCYTLLVFHQNSPVIYYGKLDCFPEKLTVYTAQAAC